MSDEPIFARLTGFFKKLFGGNEPAVEQKTYSKFDHFLTFIDESSPVYANARNAAAVCDEALKIARQRITLANRIKEANDKLTELDFYTKLSEEDAKQLKNLLERFISLTKERNVLIYQLTGFDRTLSRMIELEDEALNAIPQMQDAEKYQRALRQDLAHLEGEKTELEHERGILETGVVFISRFSVACVFLFGFVAIFLAYLFMISGTPIFLPTTVLVLLAITVIVLLYMFNKRIRYELKVNIKKQQRAVEILNKKNVVYAYYTNFLRFEYGKYKVRSTQMLKSNLKDYKNYRHITMRIDAIRRIMYETEAEISRFLRERGVANSSFAIEQFAKTVDVSDKMEYTRELANEKAALEKRLFALDEKHGRVWDLLESLQEKDDSDDHIIDQMIQSYFNEVSDMLASTDSADDENSEVV